MFKIEEDVVADASFMCDMQMTHMFVVIKALKINYFKNQINSCHKNVKLTIEMYHKKCLDT